MKRIVVPELLDSDSGTVDEIYASLRDLKRINRWGGGISTTRWLVEREMRRAGLERATLLSVGAGDGYSVWQAAKALFNGGLHLDVTLLDRSGLHLRGAKSTAVVGDAFALPFADDSFDFVECSLFVHHLEPVEVVRFACEALRVARRAFLINDLRRSRVHLVIAWCGLPLFRSRITRHDALASIRRAYTPVELAAILKGPGCGCDLKKRWFFRMGAVVRNGYING